MELVRGAIDNEADLTEAIAALAEISLLKHNPLRDGGPAVTVHAIIKRLARNRSKANGTAKLAWDRLLMRLTTLFPELFEEPSLADGIAPNLESLISYLRRKQEELRDRRDGSLDDGERYYEVRGEELPPKLASAIETNGRMLDQTKLALTLLIGMPW